MMSPKPENMDEEKSFEVIQEGAPKDFENSPHLVRRGLTEVSAMFDRTGKGYLDETERALRRMDSQDRGYLGIDKVCVIFESLQAEQERSSQLLEALRTESKKSLNLKKGVIALTFFTVLLALANVGTSFAVSKLVKDTQVSNGDLLAKSTGERLGTTSKLMTFSMESLDETRRRRLQANAGLICETMAATITQDDGTTITEKECSLQGIVKLSVAKAIYTQLESIHEVVLDCNNKKSVLYGVTKLPVAKPSKMMMGDIEYMVFPSKDTDDKYEAMQEVRVPAQRATPATPAVAAVPGVSPAIPAKPARPARPARNCEADYELAMYCPTELINGKEQDCFVMSAYDRTESCPTSPVVCGPYQPNPLIS